jgi:hypothetical protein
MTQAMRRTTETAGMLMIGDAVLALVRPTRHALLWRLGPSWMRDLVEWLAIHPTATRAIAAAELGAGLWLSLRQEPETEIGVNAPIFVGNVVW